MIPSKSETSRVSRPRPGSMLRHAPGCGTADLVHAEHRNWHLMTAPVHGMLWTCPSPLFTARVLP